MSKNYETELPAGYREVYKLNALDKKVSVLLTVASFVVTIGGGVLSALIIKPHGLPTHTAWFLIVMILYIVAHELVHGAAYKLLTKRKLTFGITLTVAYCGVPDIYVYRKAALISLAAPLTVFSVLFLAAAFLFTDSWDAFLAAAMFSVHLGGCVGDIYDIYLYLAKFRDPLTLMRDTGPEQTFYVKG